MPLTCSQIKEIYRRFDQPIVYRGIVIMPTYGKRSKLARAVRKEYVRHIIEVARCP